MEVASFCSLPLGIVRWYAPAPMLSVVVKATFRLDAGAEATLAEHQEPLSLDVGDPAADRHGLRVASDFAPRKARTDVLLVGHAFAAEPARVIAARLVVDVLDVAFAAVAREPAQQIALVPRHVRASASADAPVVAVGPRAAGAPERAVHGLGAVVDRYGAVVAPLGQAPNYAFFNAARVEQQLGLLRPNATLWFEGLSPGGRVVQVELPGHRPRVFAVEEGKRTAPEIQLAIDTLWIDTDRQIAAVTWRGWTPIEGGPGPALLVLALEPRGAPCRWATLRDQIQMAVRSIAVEAEDLIPGTTTEVLPGDDGWEEPSTIARSRREDLDEPTAIGPPPRARSEPPLPLRDEELIVEEELPTPQPRYGSEPPWMNRSVGDMATGPHARPVDAPPAARATLVDMREAEPEAPPPPADPLPFRRGLGIRLASWGGDEEPAPASSRASPPEEVTHVKPAPAPARTAADERRRASKEPLTQTIGPIPGLTARDVLPFDTAAPPPPVEEPPTPALPEEAKPRARRRTEVTAVVDVDQLRSAPLPFSTRDEESTGVVDPAAIVRGRDVPFAPSTPAVGRHGPAPPGGVGIEPTARDAAGVERPAAAPPGAARWPLEEFAAARRAAWRGRAALARALASKGVSQVAWLEQEQLWGDALSAEAERGGNHLARALRSALASAERRKTKDAAPLDLAAFASLELLAPAARAAALADRDQTLAAFRRAQRRFTALAKRDPEAARALAEARSAAKRPGRRRR